MDVQPCDGVFEGGGVKGLALAGAIEVFEDYGYRFDNLAGTSAGAIAAALLASGYTGAELYPIMRDLDFTQFMDSGSRRFPHTAATLNLLFRWGFYKGDAFLKWIDGMLAAKGVHTFADLRRKGVYDERTRYRLRVVASDVTRGQMIVLPQSARSYNIDPDSLNVAQAVRMSMSIPYFFRPVQVRRLGAPPAYIVDGALLSNFPISLFDGPQYADQPTFGFRLSAGGKAPAVKYKINWLLSYLAAMFFTATEASDNYFIETHDFLRTVNIDNMGISTTKFALTSGDKEILYQSGRRAARLFLETWDFASFKQRRDRWAGRTRRELILESLDAPRIATPEHGYPTHPKVDGMR